MEKMEQNCGGINSGAPKSNDLITDYGTTDDSKR